MATSISPRGLVVSAKKCVVPGLNHFYVHFHQRNVVQPIANMWLNRPYGPLKPKIIHAYQEREKDILWWGVAHANLLGCQRTIRSYCARKMRRAFAEALRDRGFDTAGKKLVFDSEGNITERRKSLKGTLDIRMNKTVLGAQYTSLLRDAKILVDHLRDTQLPRGLLPTEGHLKDRPQYDRRY